MWQSRSWRLYESMVRSNPMVFDAFTSALLWGAGDLSAQGIEQREEIDWKRVGIQATYASVIWAPFGHYWYRALDRIGHHIASSLVPSQRRIHVRRNIFLTSKIVLEALLLHPVALLGYFVTMGKMSGTPDGLIGQKLREDFIPTLSLEIALWTPLDLANFILVPVRHQLLVVNCGCFVESVALSFVQRNGFPTFENPK